MPNYTTGAVLGAATTLPATAAGTLFLLNRANTWVIMALLTLSAISLCISIAMMVRFAINHHRRETQLKV